MAERKVKNEDVKISGKVYPDVSNKTLRELLELNEATVILTNYYINAAKANSGEYEFFDTKKLYEDAKSMMEKYNNAHLRVLYEIEKRVGKELFDE